MRVCVCVCACVFFIISSEVTIKMAKIQVFNILSTAIWLLDIIFSFLLSDSEVTIKMAKYRVFNILSPAVWPQIGQICIIKFRE